MKKSQRRSELNAARRRLWRVTFTIIGVLIAGIIYLAAEDPIVVIPDFLPSRRILGMCLIGTAFAFMLHVMDSERKLARLADRLMREQAERMMLAEHEAEQRDFISLTAHELRTPLTVIKGFVATLANRGEVIGSDQRTRYLSIVNDQTDRLSRLVDDLMEVSRIEAGRLSLTIERIDLNSLLSRLLEAHPEWDGRVKLAGEDTEGIEGDPARVEAIVANLVENAVKYSDGPVEVESRNISGDQVEIAVHDEGPGIAPDELAGLFDKFQRLPSAIEADIPGTGLGLYIVRALAEAHGGNVHVTSHPGAGSTFAVRLPAARALRASA